MEKPKKRECTCHHLAKCNCEGWNEAVEAYELLEENKMRTGLMYKSGVWIEKRGKS